MIAAISGGAGSDSCHGWQADEGVFAQRCDAFQGHVAAVLDGPLVVLFEQDGADRADDCVRATIDPPDRSLHALTVGKIPTTSVRRLISPLGRSIGLFACGLVRCSLGKLM